MLRNLVNRLLGSTGLVPQGFDIGNRNSRRLSAIPANQLAINTLILQYGATSIARSRYLCTNNPYASAAKEAFVVAMAGGLGIRPSTLEEDAKVKKQVHDDWSLWTEHSDVEGIANFAGQQAQAAAEWFEAGECFGIFEDTNQANDGEDIAPLSIRLIPAEMLPYYNQSTEPLGAPDNYIQLGIEFTPEGRRAAYHFLTVNPTDITDKAAMQGYRQIRVPADRVFHLYRPLRVGQVRGVPFTLSALVSTAMLDLYDDAELERKRVSALFAAFVTRNNQDDDHPLGKAKPVNATQGWVPTPQSNNFTLQPGVVVDLLPGEDIKFSTPADSGGNYDPYEYRMLCRLAAGFGVPFAQMTGDLKAANYGSIRAGLVQFRRRIESMQYQNFIPMFLRRVWLRFLLRYTLAGLSPWTAADWLANKRQHQKVKWLTPRWDWVDPLKDMQAEKLAVDNGFKSRFDTVEESGCDPDENDQRIIEAQASEAKMIKPLNTGALSISKDPKPDPTDANPPSTKENPNAQ